MNVPLFIPLFFIIFVAWVLHKLIKDKNHPLFHWYGIGTLIFTIVALLYFITDTVFR